MSRRDFLRRTGATVSVALAAAAGLTWAQGVREEGVLPADAKDDGPPAMLVDLTRCVGCNSCALACKAKNGLPNADAAPSALDNEAYTYVAAVAVKGSGGEDAIRYVKRQCMHCLEAACVAACPAAAMYRSEAGPIVYRPNRCLGCRYCQVACPFDVPAFDWSNPITPRISKCWFCYDRLRQGERPACVAACPTGALRFGSRSQLLAQAHARIASMPDRYVDHVFGEREVGGTSMLYLSDMAFEELGFPAGLGEEPPPVQTEKVMRTLPAVILGAGALAAGTAMYTHRHGPHEGSPPEARADGGPGAPDQKA